jgi:hemoglobin-like flavoprotein
MIDRGKAATFELGERDERSLEGGWPLSLEQETRSMTAHPIDLVQSSFAKVTPIADTAAVIFYDRLFEIAPEVRPLFNGDMAEQRRKLMATLGVVVNGLKNLDAVLPAARTLAVKHVGYGVKATDYTAVGEALIFALDRGLGPDFTSEVRSAWLAAYSALSSAMIAAARGEQGPIQTRVTGDRP